MADRHTRIASGAPWESQAGYSRAVRAGHFVAVSGSAAVGPDGEVVGGDDMYLQSRRCVEVLGAALDRAGASFADVIRTRIYVTDIDRWPAVARAHKEAFGDAPPATSMVEVSRLIHPRMLVEMEADAIIAGD